MGGKENISLVLVTGYAPRGEALISILEDSIEKPADITAMRSLQEAENRDITPPNYCVLDLANIKGSSISVVKTAREKFRTSSLLGIHIYTTRLLVDPLFDAGIDAYLPYEPSKKIFAKAFKAIDSGEQFAPDDFL